MADRRRGPALFIEMVMKQYGWTVMLLTALGCGGGDADENAFAQRAADEAGIISNITRVPEGALLVAAASFPGDRIIMLEPEGNSYRDSVAVQLNAEASTLERVDVSFDGRYLALEVNVALAPYLWILDLSSEALVFERSLQGRSSLYTFEWSPNENQLAVLSSPQGSESSVVEIITPQGIETTIVPQDAPAELYPELLRLGQGDSIQVNPLTLGWLSDGTLVLDTYFGPILSVETEPPYEVQGLTQLTEARRAALAEVLGRDPADELSGSSLGFLSFPYQHRGNIVVWDERDDPANGLEANNPCQTEVSQEALDGLIPPNLYGMTRLASDGLQSERFCLSHPTFMPIVNVSDDGPLVAYTAPTRYGDFGIPQMSVILQDPSSTTAEHIINLPAGSDYAVADMAWR